MKICFHKWKYHSCGTKYHRICKKCGRLQQEGVTPFFSFWFDIDPAHCDVVFFSIK